MKEFNENLLVNLGLTQSQAEVLVFLIENGEDKASSIARKLKRPRGAVYKVLDELIEMGFVKRVDKRNMVSLYYPEHPSKLEKLAEAREKELEKNKKALEGFLPDLVSSYNLSQNKPGVRFFEGKEGIEKVLWDTLRSKTEVYTFTDSEAVRNNLKELNEKYVRERRKAGIVKKIIAPETARKYYKEVKDELTEVRFLKESDYPFKTGMQIYDGKISYQTLGEDNKIGVLIEDKHIYTMHKMFFEYIWKTLEKNKKEEDVKEDNSTNEESNENEDKSYWA